MRRLLQTYCKMLRAGFFSKSMFVPVFLAIPAIFSAFGVKSDIFSIYLIFLGGYTTYILIMGEVSEKRYVLYTTLPIEINDIIKVSYLHTYTIYILGFIGTLCTALIGNTEVPMISLVSFALYILCANIFYPYFASTELKLGANQQDKASIWIVMVLVIMMVMGIFIYAAASIIQSKLLYYGEMVMMLVFIAIAVLTLNKSYSITRNKIMGIDYRK